MSPKNIAEQELIVEQIIRDHPYLSFEGNLLDATITELSKKIVAALGEEGGKPCR